MVTDKTKLIELAKKYRWPEGGYDSTRYDQPSAIIVGADGGYIIDIDGNRIFESLAGLAGCTLGRSNSYIIEAITRQLKINPIVCSAKQVMPVEILCAKKVASHTPGNLNKVFFGMSGSDANEIAFKIARQYWDIMGQGGKYKIISRWWSYHGGHYGSGAAAGYPHRRVAFEPFPAGYIHINPPYCYRCLYGKTYPKCDLECAEELCRTIEYEGPSTIAAFIGDLVITALGPKVAPPEYVKRIREICTEYNILMIVDEVVTGWGRMGTWTASEYYNIVPDIITFGKGISALYVPLSAAVVKDEIAEVFTGKNRFQHIYTGSGNPLACAAGLATIEYLENEKILDNVKKKSHIVESEMKKIKQDYSSVGNTQNIGLEWGIELVKDRTTKKPFPNLDEVKAEIIATGLKNGVYFAPAPVPFGPILVIAPILNITDAELELIFGATRKAIEAVEKKF
jgi:taurine-pyruvate aminotransferase